MTDQPKPVAGQVWEGKGGEVRTIRKLHWYPEWHDFYGRIDGVEFHRSGRPENHTRVHDAYDWLRWQSTARLVSGPGSEVSE